MAGIQRSIGPVSQRWELHSWGLCRGSSSAQIFLDKNAAASWLRDFKTDSAAMASLREVFALVGTPGIALWRMQDDQVLEGVATLLVHGALHVHRIAPPASRFRTASASNNDSENSGPVTNRTTRRTATPAVFSSPVAGVAQEANTFAERIDSAAQAAVLHSAAASGIPFCEECAKAAASVQVGR